MKKKTKTQYKRSMKILAGSLKKLKKKDNPLARFTKKKNIKGSNKIKK